MPDARGDRESPGCDHGVARRSPPGGESKRGAGGASLIPGASGPPVGLPAPLVAARPGGVLRATRVRQAQLIGAARRPPTTTTMHTSPITLSIHPTGSGTEAVLVVLRTRLPEVTSNPNGSPRKATYPCSPPCVVPCAVSW